MSFEELPMQQRLPTVSPVAPIVRIGVDYQGNGVLELDDGRLVVLSDDVLATLAEAKRISVLMKNNS